MRKEGPYSWTVLATDGRLCIVCQSSSTSVLYENLLGYVNNTGFVSWHLIDKPDLPKHSKLFSTSIISHHLTCFFIVIVERLYLLSVPIPNQKPFEMILVQLKSQDTPRTILPLIISHMENYTFYGVPPTTTTLAFEGCEPLIS